jgi:hypothetical protein
MDLIEIREYQGPGFLPQILASNWQVAILNYAPEEIPENIRKVDRHLQTDEAFVLLSGQAILIAAQETKTGLTFVCETMLPEKIYNIPHNVWHNIVLNQTAKVLIIENRDTHLGDFEYYQLTASEYDDLQKSLQNSIKGNF